jgi:predicted membrane protein
VIVVEKEQIRRRSSSLIITCIFILFFFLCLVSEKRKRILKYLFVCLSLCLFAKKERKNRLEVIIANILFLFVLFGL